jgi:dTDP-4-dehydrorhamnose reductase
MILILGHNGLLGNMVYSYFKSKNYQIITTDLRWPSNEFKNFILNEKIDIIINCIGIIPQKKPAIEHYKLVNYELPVWLDSLGIKIIHPDTDESDDTPYGLAKRMARENIAINTKILKTSIIGFEKNTNFSFLNWFLSSTNSINGFTNQFWNGNTTLEWAKYAEKILQNWNNFNNITILSNPECLSKYEILLKFKKIFNKNIDIVPIKSNIDKNNCMKGDYITKELDLQLNEMKNFYNFTI